MNLKSEINGCVCNFKNTKKKLSVIVPMYNEEANIECFFYRMGEVLHSLSMDYEIICVNDGSKDCTLEKLLAYHQRDSKIKVISFSRNFGKEVAMTAALDFAEGDAVVLIDADLQDPPELIAQLLHKWEQGFDVVYATRSNRLGESKVKKITARLFYKVISKMTNIVIPENTGDFRLLDKRVVASLKRLPERTRFMKGLFAWVGFRQTFIMYERQPRFAGTTAWNYWKLWNFALDGITSFSFLPLKVWSYLGGVVSIFSFIYAVFLILRYFIIDVGVPGYTSTMVVMLFLGGVQLLGLGVLGEYVGRVFVETKQRPPYIISELYGRFTNIPEEIANGAHIFDQEESTGVQCENKHFDTLR